VRYAPVGRKWSFTCRHRCPTRLKPFVSHVTSCALSARALPACDGNLQDVRDAQVRRWSSSRASFLEGERRLPGDLDRHIVERLRISRPCHRERFRVFDRRSCRRTPAPQWRPAARGTTALTADDGASLSGALTSPADSHRCQQQSEKSPLPPRLACGGNLDRVPNSNTRKTATRALAPALMLVPRCSPVCASLTARNQV